MRTWVLGRDRQKRAGAHVQGDLHPANAAIVQGAQQAGREMQAGGGRRDRPVAGCENGLIIAAVAGVAATLPFDVGGQGHGAVLREGGGQIRVI